MLTSPTQLVHHTTLASNQPSPSPQVISSSSPAPARGRPSSERGRMTLTIPEEVRAKAEIYVGDAAGQEKTRFLLQETGLPSGLLPLRDILECGYVEETGFVWLRQRRKVDHYFARAGRHVTYGAEVSAFAEKGRLRKITGVKAKEMLIWVTLHEISVDDPPTGKLVCKAIGGISRTFPVEAFEADHPPTPPADKPAIAAGKPANGCGAAAAQEEVVAKNESAEEEKKEEEAKKGTAGEEKPKEQEGKDAAAIDGVEEKLKELSTAEAVQAEAVAAKN